jgi:hypothetical protein
VHQKIENPNSIKKEASDCLIQDHEMYFFAGMVDFSDEEGYGKYLDLHESYDKYINIKGIEVLTVYLLYYNMPLYAEHCCSMHQPSNS